MNRNGLAGVALLFFVGIGSTGCAMEAGQPDETDPSQESSVEGMSPAPVATGAWQENVTVPLPMRQANRTRLERTIVDPGDPSPTENVALGAEGEIR
jgi:hypothetical protein